MSDRDKESFSRTMRIDLIPDVPSEPVTGKQKRVVVAPAVRRKSVLLAALPERGSSEESHYQKLLQSVYDAALISDLSGHIVDVNVRALDFLLHESDELCRLTVFDVISGASTSLIQTLCDNLEDERFTLIQAYCVRRDGSMFPAEIAVNKLILDQTLLCFFIRDITLRRQAEEMLRTEHNALQNAENGIAVADLRSRLEYVNPAIARLWGYSQQDELLGQDMRTLFADEAAADRMIESLVVRQERWSGESVARRKEGGSFHVQISAACNRNSDGEVVGMVLSLVDITDRRRAQALEQEAERDRITLESLGAACHHLSQPATVLTGMLELMQKRLKNEQSPVRDQVDTCVDAIYSLGRILHRLNAVNKYKTTRYIESSQPSGESRILDV
jgi:PAS domain S-box-containing protein